MTQIYGKYACHTYNSIINGTLVYIIKNMSERDIIFNASHESRLAYICVEI